MATIQRAGALRADLVLWDGLTKTGSRFDATGGTVSGLSVGEFVDVLQVYGSGTDRTRATIATAISRISTVTVPLLFSTGTWTVDDDLTIPSNFACLVPAGCVFNVASGKTLTFSGPVHHDLATWTSGSGTVVLGADSIGDYGRTAAEISAGVTPTDPQYEPGDVRRYGYVADGVDGSDTGTDNATAIANCIASNVITDLPEGVGRFSGTITLPVGKMLRGKGPRKTILRQAASATVAGITLGDVVSTDISEGAHSIRDLCVKTAAHASAHGIRIGDGATAMNASMLDFSNLRIWSQQQESHVSVPYSVISGQRGIYINSAASSAVYVNNLRNVEIRAFDVAIDSAGSSVSANEWVVHGWIIDCRIGVRLSNASTWNLSTLSVESGVATARALYCLNTVSNILWSGGRWELTQANSYGVEGDATWTGQNIRISGISVLIASDGGAIPGRKWTGTLPNDFLFQGYDATPEPFIIIPNFNINLRLPNLLTIGGSGLGNSLVSLDRDAGGAAATLGVGVDGFLTVTGFNGHKIKVGSTETVRIDDSVTATHTRLMVYDVDNATLERVTVGGVDSGGTGFKVLRIPN